MNVSARKLHSHQAVCAAVIAALSIGCGSVKNNGGTTPGGSGGAGGNGATPFEPLPPAVYGTKIKNILVGQPLTDAELGALVKDAGALPGLVDTWMAQPAWRTRMFGFFQQAFQQTQTTAADFDDQLGLKTTNWAALDQALFNKAASESMARTAQALMDEGRPFTDILTTRRFMLNPPLMAAMAFMDAAPQDDDGKPIPAAWWLLKQYPMLKFTRQADTMIPFSDSIDPTSPNFFNFYDPTPYTGANANCAPPFTAMGARALIEAASFLFGGRVGCGRTVSQFADADWDNWKMVKVREPKMGELRTVFFDLPSLRTATELVVSTPRVGFLTTPAFFANWPTNTSNQHRVTMNQALIVGLGMSFDDRGTTVQVSESTSDAMHVQPGTPCFGCHQTLDPMRDFYRQTYNTLYSSQLNPMMAGIPPVATFTAMSSAPVMGNGIAALADAMAAHPRFAVAWAQKLCRLANSTSCTEDDPEFVRVAKAFSDSNYDFKTLVRTLLTSPLVTYASETKSADESGIVVGIARRETLCASLEARSGIADVCGIHGFYGKKAADKPKVTAGNLAGAIPGDGYARGSEVPLMPHDPNLFFVSGTENLCAQMAGQLVTAAAGGKYTGAKKDEAIADFVSNVMGLPASDPRAPKIAAILNQHFADAMAGGQNATDALKSTYVLACSSPLSLSSGL